MAKSTKITLSIDPPNPFDREHSPFKGNRMEPWYENEFGCFSSSGRFIPKNDEDYLNRVPEEYIDNAGEVQRFHEDEKAEHYSTEVNGWFSGPGVKGK